MGYDSSTCILGTSETSHHREAFQVSASEDLFGERQVDTVRASLGDRILIGAKVESLVPSHRNGWRRPKAVKSMVVAWRSAMNPEIGALECWSVDRELYAEHEPTKR